MGKKKQAEGKSKAKKTKIPKEIAGVRIPKTLRDSGKAAVKLAQNPIARELLSAGLAAAATAIAANTRARKAAADGGAGVAGAVNEAASAASDGAAKVGAAILDAAGDAAQRFFGLNEAAAKPDMATPDAESVEPAPVAPPVKAAQPRKTPPPKPEPTTEFPLPPNGSA